MSFLVSSLNRDCWSYYLKLMNPQRWIFYVWSCHNAWRSRLLYNYFFFLLLNKYFVFVDFQMQHKCFSNDFSMLTTPPVIQAVVEGTYSLYSPLYKFQYLPKNVSKLLKCQIVQIILSFIFLLQPFPRSPIWKSM